MPDLESPQQHKGNAKIGRKRKREKFKGQREWSKERSKVQRWMELGKGQIESELEVKSEVDRAVPVMKR